ncbi:hypothetical protein GCM10023156_58780 [Novipirellula rosea]|uniref:Uncharacterized protein n=1 Tax=Novipirellula rosea TaxID=1031540 RepID=A0ABP8NIV0_9BACT
MFKKVLIGFACAVMVAFTASDASAFHGRHHRGNACGYGGYTYSVPVRSYYRAPSYRYSGYGYGRSSYYRPSISVGIGGSPYYRSGFGGYGLGGYGYGGYPGYGFGRSGVSIGFGGFGRGW